MISLTIQIYIYFSCGSSVELYDPLFLYYKVHRDLLLLSFRFQREKNFQVDTFSVAYFGLESNRELYDLDGRSQGIKFPRKYSLNIIRFYFDREILISRAALESRTLEFYRSSKITHRCLAAIATDFLYRESPISGASGALRNKPSSKGHT